MFPVFPIHLRGFKLALAIYQPQAGESLKLVFRGTENQPSFDIGMQITGSTISNAQTDTSTIDTEITSGLIDQGWAFIVTEISADIMVGYAGVYQVFLSSPDGEQYVQTVTFAHAPRPPYSAEEITAIKSDPMARKFVRMLVTCKLCGEGLKVYAGIERSPSLESQGFRLNYEIKEDNFVCSCGKTQFSLIPIRTGLHGLLQRNVNPQTDETISAVKLYEKTALEESCRQMLKLISADTDEEQLQNLLESHPIFFHVFMPTRIMFKPKILTKYVADFALLNARNELLLVEIEKPHLRLLKKDGDITAGLEHAFHQVRTWKQELDDFRDAALDAMGLKREEVASLRGVVVAGRKPSDEKKLRLLRAASTPAIELFTYDDLLNSVTELIKQVATI